MLNKTLGICAQTLQFCRFGVLEGERAGAVRKGRRGIGLAIVFILVGGIVGSIFGRLLEPVWYPLGRSILALGTQPGTSWSVNLGVVGLQLGAWLKLNVLGVIGLIAGLFWYQRSS